MIRTWVCVHRVLLVGGHLEFVLVGYQRRPRSASGSGFASSLY